MKSKIERETLRSNTCKSVAEVSNFSPPSAPVSPTIVDSVNNPLSVSWITPCQTAAGGRLGLTYCPGKHIDARNGTLYRRDLGADLARLRQVHGAQAVVCLLPEAELRYLKVRNYGAAVAANGMEYLHLPIIEMAAPSDPAQAAAMVDAVAAQLQEGHTVVMHCKGGVGRAGLMAACVLLRMGVRRTAPEAIEAVRQHRMGAVESRRQEEFVAAYSHHLAAMRSGEGVDVWARAERGAVAGDRGRSVGGTARPSSVRGLFTSLH